MEIKNQEYGKLNEGQKAIFSFHVYYDHAKNDMDSFVYWSRFYVHDGFFIEIKNGAAYFAHPAFSKLLNEIERTFMGDNAGEIQKFYAPFKVIGQAHKIKMGQMIRAHGECF